MVALWMNVAIDHSIGLAWSDFETGKSCCILTAYSSRLSIRREHPKRNRRYRFDRRPKYNMISLDIIRTWYQLTLIKWMRSITLSNMPADWVRVAQNISVFTDYSIE